MVPLRLSSKYTTQAAGFTLAEIIITIAIVGILSTIAVGSYTRITEREKVNALTINLAAWIDQVRKASTLGSGCMATINKEIAADSTIASAWITSNNETKIERQSCTPLLSMSDISALSSSGIGYRVTSNIMTEDQTQILFTPRGTLIMPSDKSSIDLVVQLAPSGPSRCISIKDLIANITISKGESCGDQERF